MVIRIAEPIVFGFLFLALFWLSERNKNPEHKSDRKKMRFWVAFSTWMACAELASVWHHEIGSAWENHPDLTVLGTLIAFAMLNAVAPPRYFLTMFPDDGAQEHSQVGVR